MFTPKASSRYCATCEVHWPYHPAYSRCPQCDMATSLRTGDKDKILTLEEAKKRVSHIEFEKWLDNESEFDRNARQARAERSQEREVKLRESARNALRERFTEVIATGGFTNSEVEQYRAIERSLPINNNPRYENPLAD